MKALKRVEIIVGKQDSEQVLKILESHGITGYTMIKNVQGGGDKFERDGNYPADVFSNYYILVGCDNDEFETIKEPLREILAESSGVCMVSDAQWLIH